MTESAQIVRPFRGISAAERLRQRKAVLLDAGLSAVAQHGLAGTTIDAVSAHAGLSKRYFYEHFHTRDDLFIALAESLIEQVTTAVMQAVADRDTDCRSGSAPRSPPSWRSSPTIRATHGYTSK